MISFFSPRYRKDRLTLGLLVEVSEVLPLLLVDDGEDSGNGLSDSVAVLSACRSSVDEWFVMWWWCAIIPSYTLVWTALFHPLLLTPQSLAGRV